MNYHGSLDDHWGRYRIASVSDAPDGLRYELVDDHDYIALNHVRRESFTLVPDGPPHHVRNLHERLAAVRRAAHLKYGGVLPDLLVSSLRRLPDVVAANRPAEAEHYLLSLEATVGCITSEQFQQRAQAVVVTVGDNSWTPWPQGHVATPTLTDEASVGAG
ncbi:hypothetical protein ADK67_14625 [Saccharothrix sp. NRRL B-16348]|uniref:hypothetical protein n=1 Tax=Saccharothrix sp. NRRL B-16348 TaxID=1415542 RepID=UPI0006AF266D|nr:hypothetical protein [Saccharothrix sp. NRRL B-16348]KOX27057.1 hypothetical protein ADK67_14625 [Saccharothrix sp. NRRL B-16348]